MALSDAVASFKAYLEKIPERQKARDVLEKRPLPLYRAHGITTAEDLATSLAADRLIASREMAMGYLYERVMESSCQAVKLKNIEKRGWKGIDFRKETDSALYLINLKSARATSNADITSATQTNLVAAAGRALRIQDETYSQGDDNPLKQSRPEIIPIRAIARGIPTPQTFKVVNGVRIRILVGDTLWEHLGAGANFTQKIEAELGRHPVDRAVVAKGEQEYTARIAALLKETGCIKTDGSLDWLTVLRMFPDQ